MVPAAPLPALAPAARPALSLPIIADARPAAFARGTAEGKAGLRRTVGAGAGDGAYALTYFFENRPAAGLPGYRAIDVQAARDLTQRFQVFVGAQNVTNKVFFVQTNPSTVGTPRLINFGVRVRFAGR